MSVCKLQVLLPCCLLALATLTCAGCGDASGNVTVVGQVSYRGEPITNGSVTFFPLSGRPVSVVLSENGKYEIALPPGDYQVTVNVGLTLPPGWKEGEPVPPPKLVLPPEYTTHAKSKLHATVQGTDQQSIDFSLR